MRSIVFVYKSKHGIKVADYSEARPFEDNPEYQHIVTLDAAGWIQIAIEKHPDLLPEMEKNQ